jgi:hypothetical protein
MLANLVNAGLASLLPERVRAGGRSVNAYQIMDAVRQAIVEART